MAREVDPELHTIPPDRGDMDDQPKWRRDFPIDLAQDGYVARRDFTKFLGLTSLAFVVGQFWIALRNRVRRSQGKLPVVEICSVDDIAVGTARNFYYPTETDPALLIRVDDGSLLAYSNQCTHLLCPVLPEFEHGQLHCPCHRGFFDIHTGQPIAGPPRRQLPRIVLEVRGGTIYATDVEVSI